MAFLHLGWASRYESEIPKGEKPKAAKDEVKKFLSDFYKNCGSGKMSVLQQSDRFFSKEQFIQNSYHILTAAQSKKLLCERGLLFTRDFDCVPDGKAYRDFVKNNCFFREEKAELIPIRQVAEEILSNDLENLPELVQRLRQFFEKTEKKQLTRNQLKESREKLPLDGLEEEEQDWMRFTWNRILEHWDYLIWIKNEPKIYKRKITQEHCFRMDQYSSRSETLKQADKDFEAWRKAPQQELLGITVEENVLRAFVMENVPQTVDAERTTRQILRICESRENELFHICDVLRKANRWRAKEHPIEQLILLCKVLSTFSTEEQRAERWTAGRDVWRNLGYEKQFPTRACFAELMAAAPAEVTDVLEPLRWGRIVYEYLKQSFLEGSTLLTWDNFLIYQAKILEEYKKRHGDLYAAVQINEGRTREYAALWNSPEIGEDVIRAFLQRRVRYFALEIPEDESLWKEFVPVMCVEGERRLSRMKRYSKELKLMLFENKMQDQIREQAREQLWEKICESVSG